MVAFRAAGSAPSGSASSVADKLSRYRLSRVTAGADTSSTAPVRSAPRPPTSARAVFGTNKLRLIKVSWTRNSAGCSESHTTTLPGDNWATSPPWLTISRPDSVISMTR
jgi:hypothetical protein